MIAQYRGCRRVSVRLFLSLSVTSRYCMKSSEGRITRHTITQELYVSDAKDRLKIRTRVTGPSTGAPNAGRVGENAENRLLSTKLLAVSRKWSKVDT